jgi:hypothetical protein
LTKKPKTKEQIEQEQETFQEFKKAKKVQLLSIY